MSSAAPPGLVAGIDVRPALRQGTGVGRYLRGLVPALAAEGVAVVAFAASLRDRLPEAAFPGARCVDRRIPVRLLNAAWGRLGWPPFELLAGRVDVTHSPTPLPVPAWRAARVVTLHDLYFLADPKASPPEVGRDWLPRVGRALARADAVVCVSEATARAARERLGLDGGRLHVVSHGLEPHWFERLPEAAARDEAARRGARGRFLLAVGTLEPRKNYPRLIGALARLRQGAGADLGLVLAGPDGPDRGRIEAAARRLGVEGAVVLPGYQDDGGLAALYQTAAALVMPSLDEGFGFPVLEAMAAGCPVVAARAGALPEVAGDAARLVDPLDEEAIAAGIQALLAAPEEQARRRAEGVARARRFTWPEAARRTLAVYRQACARRGR